MSVSLNTESREVSKEDLTEVATILRELSEPLAAIVSNAQAGQRMGASEAGKLTEVLSDIAQDGKRAGELLGRLNELLEID